MYKLIETFKTFFLPQDDSEYLFSYLYYFEYKKVFGGEYQRNIKRLLLRQFHILLKNFYKEIVGDKYGYYNVDKITPGDTRHFAICNMMLQGFNMLSIARISGHRRLSAQQSYWGHLDYFSQSWIYNLAESIRRFRALNEKPQEAIFNINNLIFKNKIYNSSDFDVKHPVDYGYCTDINVPNNCTGDCRYCTFYFFEPGENYDEGIEWLTDCSNAFNLRLKEQLNLLQFINLNMSYDPKLLTYSLVDQERLATTTNELNRIMTQKAMVDSLIPNSDMEEFK